MIEITPAARAAIKTAIDGAGQPVIGLRLMVQSGGCAGLKYGMALELTQAPDDTVIEAGDVTVLVDPASGAHLDGATIDFVSSVDGSGFVFDNPNATSSCGCGKSFC
ncbi:iron-sulfur cluster assembly accessory protein [Rhodobacter veldkampii DSM 11550]|uniref:Iron-sulfur cluster assembly accessory protein n=1 Tax=Phaeovulum veldkampii DSM 11550 TaxID=1185920 RepID=A0A2T4JFY4_9RHOB|nr:iron-sulfur cluster assembly accessory protein [Phaeovulum veldkampii]MBK5945142.1 iron-sulfur cluster assembly accessory protein [Phaeovulum veldkampii DSM 11550]NCU20310.1 iron-sulfur cluster assembly accessory protein [Candidatus Falkowbacteria bacterium]PTE16824.1 iron-sulfur cluster assembly accessory protein [Phaeovulum veldkampii DSM 11550]TDQ54686.1 iron-sulfur cluster assembly accessory protein [Phaeovulum veldkampii DSM 11550]